MEEEAAKSGKVMPWERQLIPQYEEIKLEFKEALEDHNAGRIPSTMIRDSNGEPSSSAENAAKPKPGASDSSKRNNNKDDVSDQALNNTNKGGSNGDASISNPNNTTTASHPANGENAEVASASLANQLEDYRKVLSSPKDGPMVTFRH